VFEFSLHAGGRKLPSPHNPAYKLTENFFLFAIVNGQEIPIYTLLENGVVKKGEKNQEISDFFKSDLRYFRTPYPYGKIFMHLHGFGVKKILSLYFKFSEDENAAMIRIRGLHPENPFGFAGKINFLKPSEALKLLQPNESSIKFLQYQMKIPPNIRLLKELITVDKNHLKKGIRVVRF